METKPSDVMEKSTDGGPDDTKLTETEHLQLSLFRERATSAQNLATLRKTELALLSNELMSKYAEEGAFEVKTLNFDTGAISRAKRKKAEAE